MANRKTQDKKKSQPGQLRIVAGNWRSRRLKIAAVEGLRPTSERIRETLFNWLAPRLRGAVCLDICAGTGALGIEAMSRGAERVVFVEKSLLAVRVLKENLASLGAEQADVQHVDARQFLQNAAVEPFDIVFMDPPFAAELHNELCRLLVERGWLASGARIYLETDRDQDELGIPDGWTELKNKIAGKVRYMLVAYGD